MEGEQDLRTLEVGVFGIVTERLGCETALRLKKFVVVWWEDCGFGEREWRGGDAMEVAFCRVK
jgi:hypothetical protein